MIKVGWDRVTRDHVSRAIGEYDRLGPEQFFAQHRVAAGTAASHT